MYEHTAYVSLDIKKKTMEGSESPRPFGSMTSPFNADSAHSNSFANMNAGDMARVVRDAVVLVRDMDPCIIDWLRAVATNGNAPPPPVPAAPGECRWPRAFSNSSSRTQEKELQAVRDLFRGQSQSRGRLLSW